jgi:basic membrane protein A and related proteins
MPDNRLFIKRRALLQGMLAASAFGATARFGTSCTATSPSGVTNSAAAKDEKVTIGFIYVGPKEDYGYNQAHAEGAKALAALPWVKLVEEASVPETTAVEETMRNMIEQDGAKVIFPTSWGYFDPHSLKIALTYPEVQLFHPNQPIVQR